MSIPFSILSERKTRYAIKKETAIIPMIPLAIAARPALRYGDAVIVKVCDVIAAFF